MEHTETVFKVPEVPKRKLNRSLDDINSENNVKRRCSIRLRLKSNKENTISNTDLFVEKPTSPVLERRRSVRLLQRISISPIIPEVEIKT